MTKLLRNIGIGLIFFTTFIPLYVNNSLFFPFITGKAFVFRITVEIAFAIWVVVMLRDRKYAPHFSKISLAVTIFAVVALIADLVGLNPLRSIWSNFERMEGWITIIHMWAYFIVATSLFGQGEEGRRMWHNFFKTSLVAASLVGIYGFMQFFGWAEIHQGSSRIDASLGNAAYMAVYMLIHVFIAFYMALVNCERRQNGMVWLYSVLGVIFGFLVFATATRGTILGLVGGIALALAIYAIFGKGESRKLRGSAAGIIILFVILGVALVSAKNTSFVKGNEALNRLATISWNENKTQARGYIWPMAIKGLFENPKTAFIGVGQENFNYIFNAHYNPEMWSQEQWFDRAHNVFLDWLVAGGVIGFLVYTSLFVFAIRGIWRSELSFKQRCLLMGLFVGYAIHNIFVFDNLVSYMLFFTMLGFVHTLTARSTAIPWLEAPESPTENQEVMRDYVYVPIVLVAFLATLYFVNVRPIQANTRLIAALASCAGQNPRAEHYARALELNQYMANQEIREQLMMCASSAIAANRTPETSRQFYTLAVQQVEKQLQVTPSDARGYVIGGSFLHSVGDWAAAQPIFETANKLSPNKQSIMGELAINYMNAGKGAEAVALLEKAYSTAPGNENIKMAYASALALVGDDAGARNLVGTSTDFWVSQRMVNIYAKGNRFDKAVGVARTLIQRDPSNLQNYLLLASVYYQQGNKNQAIAELERAKVKFPEAKAQMDQIIAEVKVAPLPQ